MPPLVGVAVGAAMMSIILIMLQIRSGFERFTFLKAAAWFIGVFVVASAAYMMWTLA